MSAVLQGLRRPDAFLALLLATDALLIVGHIIFMVMHLFVWDTPGLLDYIPSDYSIVKERSFAETFQYFKSYWLVIMFLWLTFKSREAGYLAWAVTFLYIGLDDLLEIHEETGSTIARRYDYPELFGQRPRDLGEITVYAVVGAVLLTFIVTAYVRGSSQFRQRCRTLIGLTAVLAFFGIIADAFHIIFLERGAGAVFGLIEDGGELIVLSLIAWYVWYLVRLPHAGADSSKLSPRLG